MRAKFPLLTKIITSDLYRTILALCLVEIMMSSLNMPRQGGWLALILLIGWAGVRTIQRRPVKLHPLLLLGLAYGLYLSIPKTDETSIPMYYVMTAFFWMVLIYTLLIYDTTGGYFQKADWENALILLGVIIVGQTLFKSLSWYREYFAWQSLVRFEVPRIDFRASLNSTFHPNNQAALLNVIWPLLLLRLLETRRLIIRLLSGMLLISFAIILILTNSRGGILAATATAGCLVLYGLISKYPEILTRPTKIWHNIPLKEKFLAGIASISGLALVSFVFWQATFTRNLIVTFTYRSIVYLSSWELFAQSPWFGNGAASFVPQYAQAARLSPEPVLIHAHNLELQAMAISGIFGLLFLFVALYFTLSTFLALVRKNPSNERLHLYTLMAIFIGFAVHNQFDFFLENKTNVIAYAIPLALLLNFDRSRHPDRSWQVWLPAALITGLMLALPVWHLNNLFKSQERYEQSMGLALAGDWGSAYPVVCELAQTNAENHFYGFQCSLFMSLASYATGDPELMNKALEVQQTALDANPWWSIDRANYAGLLWDAGDRAAALDQIRQAAGSLAQGAAIFLNYGVNG